MGKAGIHSSLTTGDVKIVDEDGKVMEDAKKLYLSKKTFEELGLGEALLNGVIKGAEFTRPSKFQGFALPLILAGNNLMAQAQSGTGKTAAFVLGVLHRTKPLPYPQAMILCPTRELARQIFTRLNRIGQYTKLKAMLIIPDANIPKKIKDHQILIGTPGTMQTIIKKRAFDMKKITTFVLDEADEMIQASGLGDQSLRIRKLLNTKNCLILLFSATFAEKVKDFAKSLVPKPRKIIEVEQKKQTVKLIQQYFLKCNSENEKFNALATLYKQVTVGQAIIFVATRNTANSLAARLVKDGHDVGMIHGGNSTEERDKVIDAFRNEKIKVLIATNLLSRGIDILQVGLVINYDLPVMYHSKGEPDYSTYLHRIGRTGRFGRSGIAINFVHNQASWGIIEKISKHFSTPISPLPSLDQVEEMLSQLN